MSSVVPPEVFHAKLVQRQIDEYAAAATLETLLEIAMQNRRIEDRIHKHKPKKDGST